MNPAIPMVAKEASKLIGNLIDAVKEYSIANEIQETERARIRATLMAMTAQVAAHRDIVLAELKHRHKERMWLYESLSRALEASAGRGDVEISKVLAANITQIYATDGQLSLGSKTDMVPLLGK